MASHIAPTGVLLVVARRRLFASASARQQVVQVGVREACEDFEERVWEAVGVLVDDLAAVLKTAVLPNPTGSDR